MKNWKTTWRDIITSLFILTAAFGVCLLLHRLPVSDGLAGMVLVLAVFLVSLVTEGYLYGIAASFLAVLTYASIIKAVWGFPDAGSVKKLQVNMANIRKKLGICPGDNRYIINELGVGYRMQDENEV